MKRTLLTILSVLFCAITFAQSVPQGINYQAVARDASGAVLMNQALTIQFSVISDITTSAVSWQETHTVNTNDYGLYTAIIGQGIATSVGSSATFDVIDWGASNHLLKVEVDYGGGLVDMGTTAFMSVPYSMNASNVDPTDELQSLSISGDTLFISSGNYIIIPNISLINQLTVGCTDPLGVNYDPNANLDDGSCTLPMLGDYYLGGVVFYLDSNGGGLICDIQDIATAPFGCDVISVPASNSTAFGTGAQNTFNLFDICGSSAYCGGLASGSQHITTAPSYNAPNCYTGATECYLSNAQGYNDWFLPSKDEFLAIDLGIVDSVALANGGTTFNYNPIPGSFGTSGEYLTSSIYTLYPTSYYYKIIVSTSQTLISVGGNLQLSNTYYMQSTNGSLGEARYVRAIRAF